MPKQTDLSEYAKKFGKHDLERLGIFIEMPYCKVRGKPLPGKSKVLKLPIKRLILCFLNYFIEGPFEYLRNPLAGGPKTKCGNMDGYFDDVFIRGFANEGKGRKK